MFPRSAQLRGLSLNAWTKQLARFKLDVEYLEREKARLLDTRNQPGVLQEYNLDITLQTCLLATESGIGCNTSQTSSTGSTKLQARAHKYELLHFVTQGLLPTFFTPLLCATVQ